jgi:hypothetical protein
MIALLVLCYILHLMIESTGYSAWLPYWFCVIFCTLWWQCWQYHCNYSIWKQTIISIEPICSWYASIDFGIQINIPCRQLINVRYHDIVCSYWITFWHSGQPRSMPWRNLAQFRGYPEQWPAVPFNEPLPAFPNAHNCHRALLLSVWT